MSCACPALTPPRWERGPADLAVQNRETLEMDLHHMNWFPHVFAVRLASASNSSRYRT